MDQLTELLARHPGRWPLTERMGNTLSIGEDGQTILDDRAGGIVNRYDFPPDEEAICDELDCQEGCLAP